MSQKIRTPFEEGGSLFFIIYIPTLRVGIYIIKNKNPNEKNQNLLIFFIRRRNTVSISCRNCPKWVVIRNFFRVLDFLFELRTNQYRVPQTKYKRYSNGINNTVYCF